VKFGRQEMQSIEGFRKDEERMLNMTMF